MESLVWIESFTYKSFAGIFTTAQRKLYIYTLLKQGYFSPVPVHAVNGLSKKIGNGWIMACERTCLEMWNDFTKPKTSWKKLMGQAPVVSHSPWTWHSSCYATPEYVWDNVLLSDCWSLNEPVGHMISLCPDLISSNQSQAPVDE